jgi:dTDP-4-dehydrorhamnose reductase
MKILITGAKGQLGQTFSDVFAGHNLILVDRDELDITDLEKVENYVEAKKPEVIINCAAYTAVDKAEEEPEIARKINAEGAENLAKEAKKINSILVHFSTDFVFDGKSDIPYSELQTPSPLSIYGKTKFEGEKMVFAVGGRYFILRTSWLYSQHGKNFVKTIAKLGLEKDELKVVSDQIGSPTYTYDLAFAAGDLISQANSSKLKADSLFGLYNYSNDGECSWFEFAKEIVKLSGGKARVLPQTAYEYATSREGVTAERPAYSPLNCDKIKKLGIKTLPWQESLAKCIEILKSNKEPGSRNLTKN